MKRYAIYALSFAFAAGCSYGGVGPVENAPVSIGASSQTEKPAAQNVYWTLYGAPPLPQVQNAGVPLKRTSSVTNIKNNSTNGLTYTSGLTFYRDHLWILSYGKEYGAPGDAVVFDLPLTSSSKPHFTFQLQDTAGEDALAFDPSGNLWVSSPDYHTVLEYRGPFDKSGRLKPKLSINDGGSIPGGMAFDKAANLYISVSNSSGSASIAVLPPPYTKKSAVYYLNGLTSPANLGFDMEGNLYALTNGSSGAGVARYDSDNLQSGAVPNVVDHAGLPSGSYLASLAFTSAGNLYAANCGDLRTAGIDVYPLAKKKLTSTLAPSLQFSDSKIASARCVWGIAIH